MLKDELIISFPSVHFAMRMETLLNEISIRFILKSKPRWLTSECGLAISFERNDIDLVNYHRVLLNEHINSFFYLPHYK